MKFNRIKFRAGPLRTCRWFYHFCRTLLAATMVAFGAIKLIEGHNRLYALSPFWFYGAAGLEIVIGLSLAWRNVAIACYAVVSIVVVGWLVSHAYPGRDCGCLGSLIGKRRAIFDTIASCLAVLACVTLLLHRKLTSSASLGASTGPSPMRCTTSADVQSGP